MWLLKNLIGDLLLFPSLFLWLLGFAWLLRKRRPGFSRALGVFAFVGLVLLSATAVPLHLIGGLEREIPALDLNDAKLGERADAIVILGAGRSLGAQEYGQTDVVSPQGFLRLRYGVELQRRTGRPILTSGGKPGGPGQSEAALMAAALKENLGSDAKWQEDQSINTGENARFSYRILAPLGLRRIFLVTHAAHMARAARSFEKAGFQVVPAPMGYLSDRGSDSSVLSWVPNSRGVEMSAVYFHEIIGALWYRLTGS